MTEEINQGNEIEDDGSLAFLQIPRDENNRSFNCDTTIAPWLGWAQHSDSKHLLSTILKPSFYGYLFRQATA